MSTKGIVRRAVWPLVATVLLVGVVFVGVFPSRTWLAQRDQRRVAERRLAVLQEQNDALARQVELLQTDREIERVAREHYDLVRPGEEVFRILPPRPYSPQPVDDWVTRARAGLLADS